MKCTKAIIAVAGYGTRRLPVTKTVEKCMLPLLNRPIIDYIVEDCVRAGIKDIFFVVSGNARQLRSYFARDEVLEDYLLKSGKEELLEGIVPPEGVTFYYLEQNLQDGRYGTSVPVWTCNDVVSTDEHALVIMGDQYLFRGDGGSEAADLISFVEKNGHESGMIAVEVPEDEVEKYGILKVDDNGKFESIVEKPKREEAPSRLNNASFYLFNKEMFQSVAAQVNRPIEGEYFLTDAINSFVQLGGSMVVMKSKAVYLDCGNVKNWVQANTYLLEREEQAGNKID